MAYGTFSHAGLGVGCLQLPYPAQICQDLEQHDIFRLMQKQCYAVAGRRWFLRQGVILHDGMSALQLVGVLGLVSAMVISPNPLRQIPRARMVVITSFAFRKTLDSIYLYTGWEEDFTVLLDLKPSCLYLWASLWALENQVIEMRLVTLPKRMRDLYQAIVVLLSERDPENPPD